MITDYYYYHSLSKENQILYATLHKSIASHSQACIFQGKYTSADIEMVIHSIVEDNPMFYYLDTGRIQFSLKDTSTNKIMFTYFWNKQECENMNSTINANVQKIMDMADVSGKSEAEKVRRIHDVLASNISYADDALYAESDEVAYVFAHSLLGVFLRRTAVCDGISKAFKYILNHADIKCLVVSGTAIDIKRNRKENHAWNIVKINDESYHIDLTWDVAGIMSGRMSYDYFNLNDCQIGRDHYDYYGVPECHGIEENYFVKRNSVVRDIYELHKYINEHTHQFPADIYIRLDYQCDMHSEFEKVKQKVINNALNVKRAIKLTGSFRSNQSIIRVIAE